MRVVRAAVTTLGFALGAPAVALAVVPDTFIDSGPPSITNSRSATVTFHSDDPAATFECRHDTTSFTACTSPRLVASDQPEGPHTFYVRAVDGADIDPTPATVSWTTDYTPPDTTVTPTAPPRDQATVVFHLASEPGATFQCRRNGESFRRCPAEVSIGPLANGRHTFQARAIDLAGNVDPTPATVSWRVAVPPAVRSVGSAFDATRAQYPGILGICLGAIDYGTRAIKCFGQTAPHSGTLPDRNTLFAIGSVTKVFTATLLAVNVVEGKVALNDPVRSLISPAGGKVNYPNGVTLLDLAQHHSGLPDNPPDNTVYSVHDLLVDAGECYLTVVEPGCPVHLAPEHTHPLDYGYSYSNLGYELLGQVLGLRDGFAPKTINLALPGPMGNVIPPWEPDLDAAVINPLHMNVTKSYIAYTGQANHGYYEAHVATGLASNGSNWDPNSRNGAPFTDAAGSLYSSPTDMLKFLGYSMRGDAPGALGRAYPLLYRSPTLVPLRSAKGPTERVALGWFLNPGHGYTVVSKGGDVEGFHAEIAFAEHQDRGVVVLLNQDTPPGESRVDIACTLLRKLPPLNHNLPCPGHS